MAYLNDRVLDYGLNVLDTEANRMDICNAEPTTYAQATTTPGSSGYSLGYKTSYSIPAPSDRSPNGREVVCPAVTDGTVNYTGTASHWAVTDTSNSRLLATNTLAATQAVTSGNTWTSTSYAVGIPDGVSV